MKLTLLALVLAGFAAQVGAATITPVTACEIEGAPVSCEGHSPFIELWMTGSGPGGHRLDIETYALAFSGMTYSSVNTIIDLDFMAIGEGPVRQGLATYAILAESDVGPTRGRAFASVAGVGECDGGSCLLRGAMAPFTLGLPFQVRSRARATAPYNEGSPPGPDGGWAYSMVTLELFELSGEPVRILLADQVPEPATWGLISFGLLATAAISRRSTARASRR